MSGGRNEAALACRVGTGRGRVRGWWCRHEWSSSGSKGRGRDVARRGLGCRSGDETERAATPSWKAMIRSAARRRGDVDARWQDTLLRSSSGSTARVRELGSPGCRRVLVGLPWRVVAWRAAAGGIARAAGLRCPPCRGAKEGTEEGERERRKKGKGGGSTEFDSN